MKRKLLSYCALIAVCGMLTACNGSSDNAKSTDIKVEKVAEPANSASSEDKGDITEKESKEAKDADSTEAGTAASSIEESKYDVFTDASNAEVEAFAKKVVDAVNTKDWNTVGDLIQYPIGSKDDNNLCSNKEEFIAYANNTGFNQEEMTALASWDISDLWANWQGACINNGSIWFRDVDTEKKELKIVSLFELREAGGEITD